MKESSRSSSLTTNFFLNTLKTLGNIIFPFIAFAYTSRILGTDGIGKIHFAKAFVSYFMMIASLGVNQYGMREVAKIRNDKEEIAQFSCEILTLSIITTIISYALLYMVLLFSDQLKPYSVLIWINSISIVLSCFGIEWLYQGLEQYKYISIRSLIFQIIAFLLMITFVKSKSDIYIFAFINVLSSSGSLIINFFCAKKYLWRTNKKHLDIKKHIPPMLWLFTMALSIEIYTVLDTTMLGLLAGDNAVGLYSASIKINRVINGVVTSLGVVLMPRIAYYFKTNAKEEMLGLIEKGYNYIFMLSVPACVGMFVVSREVILLVSGHEFLNASVTMRIMSIVLSMIPVSIMTNNQLFIPIGKEKLILLSTGLGAAVNFISNALLIPRYAENGAAIGTVIAEAVVVFVCLINLSRFFSIKKIFSSYYQYWVSAIPILVIGFVANRINMTNDMIRLAIIFIFSCISYASCLFIFKNRFFMEVFNKFGKLVKRGSGPR